MAYRQPMKPSLTALLAASALLALAGCQKADDAAFGQRVRSYLLAHPEVLEEMIHKLDEKKQAQADAAVKAAIGKYRAQLERDPRDFVANPGGKYTVVEFFDYRCSYCKLAAPEVLKLIAANPDVRFVFKELPIFGGPSTAAAKVALTPGGKAKSLALYRDFMADKALDEAAIDRHLSAAGIDPAAARAQGEDPAIQDQLKDVADLAAALDIKGTPAFLIGDRMIPGADMAALKAAIQQAKAGELKRPGG